VPQVQFGREHLLDVVREVPGERTVEDDRRPPAVGQVEFQLVVHNKQNVGWKEDDRRCHLGKDKARGEFRQMGA